VKNISQFHINGLRAVAVLSRYSNLSQAADELGVSPGAVSKNILKIEGQIGRPLFDRTPGGFVPLRECQPFLADLRDGFGIINSALEGLNTRANRAFRVTVAPGLAKNWLISRLPSFYDSHVGLQLIVDSTSDMADLGSGDYACAIRYGRGQWTAFNETMLLRHELFPVCSPCMASRLKEVTDLAHTPVIREQNGYANWREWLQAADAKHVALRNELVLSASDLCVEAAISGLGVALVWQTQALDAIQAGQLVVPFPISAKSVGGYWFLEPKGAQRDMPTTDFKRWLIKQMAASQCDFDQLVGSKTGWRRVGSL
jgi:LysR family transcriptional regulator, glycine cleavage system transcriptional activator